MQYAVTIGLAPLTAAWFAQISLSARQCVRDSVGQLGRDAGRAGGNRATRAARCVRVPACARGARTDDDAARIPCRLAGRRVLAAHARLAGAGAGLRGRRMGADAARLAALGGPLTWLPLVAPASDAPPPGGFRLTVFDVGQGASVLVETARRTLLFDAGRARSRPTPARGSSRRRCAHRGDRFARAQSRGCRSRGRCTGRLCGSRRAPAAGRHRAEQLWRDAAAAGVADRLPCAAGQRWTWTASRSRCCAARRWAPRTGGRACCASTRARRPRC